MNLSDVKTFIKDQSPETKIYIGADSERVRVDEDWFVDYTLAIVIHIDGKHGAKVFGEVQRERDFDKHLNKPRLRLMTECYKVSELYLKLGDVLETRHVEIHLDINTSPKHGSSCVISEAMGYIRGVCNIEPKVKPQAFAASYCADRLKFILSEQEKRTDTNYFINVRNTI